VNQRRPKVLYVDDEESNLVTFKYCFTDRFEVVVARSGKEALALMGTEPVAVLLADQRMPGMSGAELCAIAKDQFPQVVRMIVTAYADIRATVDAINSGQVSRYILKPWNEDRMAEELRIGLRAYELGLLVSESHASLLRANLQTAEASLLGQEVHEFSNPLTSLCGGLREAADLADELVTDLAIGTRRPLGKANALRKAVKTAVVVADDLSSRVELFRRGEPAMSDQRATANVNQAAEAALAILSPELRRQVRVTLRLVDVPLVAAPPIRICQVLANLLTNAIEALEPDSPRQRRVTVTTAVRDECVVVEIRDTGRGISPDALAKVFEPFVSTKGQDRPRGLGMAVVRDIVRRMHGEVRISSEVGRGTCVTVELPLAR